MWRLITNGDTSLGMAIAWARATDHQLIDGVPIFLINFGPVVKQIIAQCVQFGKIDAQIGDFEQFRDLGSVRVLGGNVRGNHFVDQLKRGGLF